MNPWGNVQLILSLIGIAILAGIATLGQQRERRKRRAIEALLIPYCKGDFAATLEVIEVLRPFPREYSFFRGGVLLQLGDLKQAETLLLQSIALSEQPEGRIPDRTIQNLIRLNAVRRTLLGELYLEQSRYDDALRCFEAASRDWPNRGSTHRAVAETWLRSRRDPATALRWARLAVQADRAPRNSPQAANDTELGEDLGTLAWAVAVATQDRAEVDRLVDEAALVVGSYAVTSSAQVQYHSGLAYAALGDGERSVQHLNEAASIDIKGRWGRAARAALTLSTTQSR